MIQGVLDIHPGNSDIYPDDICPCIMEPQRGFILIRPPAYPHTAHLFLTEKIAQHTLEFGVCL